jgi:hypothetical protein
MIEVFPGIFQLAFNGRAAIGNRPNTGQPSRRLNRVRVIEAQQATGNLYFGPALLGEEKTGVGVIG